MSMSLTGLRNRVLRTHPPTNRAHPSPPAALSAAITFTVEAWVSQDCLGRVVVMAGP
jgi:hypothetical protein